MFVIDGLEYVFFYNPRKPKTCCVSDVVIDQYDDEHPSDMDLTKDQFIQQFKNDYSEEELDWIYDKKKEYLRRRELWKQAQSLINDLEQNPISGEIYQSLMYIFEKLGEDWVLFDMFHEREKWKSFISKLKERILTKIRYCTRFIYKEPFIW